MDLCNYHLVGDDENSTHNIIYIPPYTVRIVSTHQLQVPMQIEVPSCLLRTPHKYKYPFQLYKDFVFSTSTINPDYVVQ